MSNFLDCKFKHFTFDDYDMIVHFFSKRESRFYKSLMYLTQSKKFRYTKYKDCLIIIKRGHIMNNKYVYLMMPPMHKHGILSKEILVFEEISNLGIKTKLSQVDIDDFNINANAITIDKGNDEFIYSTDNILSMRGKHWGRVRSYINKNNSLLANDQIKVQTHHRVSPILMRKLRKITEYWINNHKKMRSILYYLENLNLFNHAYITWVEHENGDILGYTISEDYDKDIILTMPVKNYKIEWKYDINAYVMNQVAKYWYVKKGQHVIMNIGASVGDKGLHKNKSKYEPYYINQLYTNKVDKSKIDDIYLRINI